MIALDSCLEGFQAAAQEGGQTAAQCTELRRQHCEFETKVTRVHRTEYQRQGAAKGESLIGEGPLQYSSEHQSAQVCEETTCGQEKNHQEGLKEQDLVLT